MPTSVGDLAINVTASTAQAEDGLAALASKLAGLGSAAAQADSMLSRPAQAIVERYDTLGTKLQDLEKDLQTLNSEVLKGASVGHELPITRAYAQLNEELIKTKQALVDAGQAAFEGFERQLGGAAQSIINRYDPLQAKIKQLEKDAAALNEELSKGGGSTTNEDRLRSALASVNAELAKTRQLAQDATTTLSEGAKNIVARYDPLGTKLRSLQADLAKLNDEAKRVTSTQDKAGLEKAFAGINAEIKSTEKAIDAASGRFNFFSSAASDAQRKIVAFAGSLVAAFTAIAAIRAFENFIASGIEAQATLQDVADKVGATASALSSFIPAAKLSGTSLEEVGAASVKFSKTLVDVQSGQGKAAAAFKAIGLSAEDAARSLKDPTQGLFELSKRLSTYADDGNKAAAVTELLGKSGANLLPFLKQLAEQSELSATVTDRQAQAAKALQDQWGELGLRSDALKNSVAGALVPAFSVLVGALDEATSKSGGLRDAVKALAEDGTLQIWALNVGVALAAAGEAVVTFIKGVQALATAIPVAVAGLKLLADAASASRGDPIAAASIKGDLANFQSELSIASKALKDFWDYNGNVTSTAIANERRLLESRRDTFLKTTAAQRKAMQDFSKSVEGFAVTDVGTGNRPSVNTKSFAGDGAKKVDEYAKALERFRQMAGEADAALSELLDGRRITAAQKAFEQLKATDVWKTFTASQQAYLASLAEATSATQSFTELQRRLTGLAKELDASNSDFAADYQDKFNTLNEAFNRGIISLERFQDLTQKLLNQQPFAKAQAAALQEMAKAEQQVIDLMARMQEQATQTLGQYADENTRIAQENELLGLSEDARARALVLMDAQADRQKLISAGDAVGLELLDQEIAKRQELVTAQIAISDHINALKDTFRDIADAGANFIEDFVQHGGKAFKNLWNNFKSWALSAFAKIAAQTVVINIAQSLGAGGIAANALAGSNPLASLLGLGNSASGLLGGGGLLSGIGSLIGGGFGTALGAGFSASLSSLSIAASAGVEAIGGIGAALGALSAVALPVVGVVAAVAAAFGLFGKGGGPKGGGFASETTDLGTGQTLADVNASRFFTPSDADATVKSIVDSISATYQQVAKQFGASLSSAQFALGFDTDPKGTAQNRISASASVNGQQTFGIHDVEVGRDDAQLQAKLAEAAQRALLSALQASDLPQYIANILDSVDAASATSEQINAIIATASAVKQAVDTISGLGDQFANLDPAAIQSFITAFGGVDQLLSAVAASYQGLYTDAERAADATNALNDTFAQFGLQAPKNYKAYRDLIDSIDLTTEAGQQEYATLLKAIPAWTALHGTAQDATDAINAQAEATKQLVQSAEDFYNENFFTDAEKMAKQQAAYNEQLNAFQQQFGQAIPRTIQGFRDFINAIDRTTAAGEAEYQAAIQAAPAVLAFANATEDAASTIDDAADVINDAAKSINVGYGAIISAGEKLAAQLETQIDTAINGLDFKDQLSKKVELIGDTLAGLQQRKAEESLRFLDDPALDFAIAALNRDNQKATTALASFVTLTAQYGDKIAEQLVQLQESHAQDLFDLRGASPDVLAQLNETFAQKWQDIIDGTSAGVDGTINQLDKLRDAIRDYLASLRQSDLSPLKPGQKLAEAQAAFFAEVAKAQTGDATALGDVTKFADTYLKDARDVFASGKAFSDIFEQVEASLEGLVGAGNAAVGDVATNSVMALAAALPEGQLASNDVLLGLRADVDAVRDAVVALADVVDGAADRSTATSLRAAKLSPALK